MEGGRKAAGSREEERSIVPVPVSRSRTATYEGEGKVGGKAASGGMGADRKDDGMALVGGAKGQHEPQRENISLLPLEPRTTPAIMHTSTQTILKEKKKTRYTT